MLGGIKHGRPLLDGDDPYGRFEQTVNRVLGDVVRSAPDVAGVELWSALANIDWVGPNGEEVGYSFRAAGDLVAALVGDGTPYGYMRWYCAGPDGTVAEWIAEAMAKEGYRWERL